MKKNIWLTKIVTINATIVLLLRIRLDFSPLRGHESLFTASIETRGRDRKHLGWSGLPFIAN